MKKLLALLLILTVCSLSMFSCWKKDKDDNNDGGSENGGNLDDGSNGPDEESGDGDTPDNIDPDGWTKVDK